MCTQSVSKKCFFAFFLIFIVLCYPLIQHGFLQGDDWEYHLARIENIKDSLLTGDFCARIHPTSLNGYGYGSGLFYPNFFLYFPAFLRVIGFGLSLSYKFFLFFIVIALIFSTYFSFKYILQNEKGAYIGTILYLFSNILITDMYIRTAVGEALAMIFLPVLICGIYNLLKRNFDKPWILIVAFLGLTFSHIISLYLSLILVLFVCLIKSRYILSKCGKLVIFSKTYKIRIIHKLILCAIIVLLLSISFWLPMIEQILSNEFDFNFSGTRAQDCAITIPYLFSFKRNSIGVPLLILSLILPFLQKSHDKITTVCLLMGWFLCVATTKIFPYEKFYLSKVFDVIQFPWRLFIFATLFLSLAVANGYLKLLKKEQLDLFIILIVLITGFFSINMLNEFSQGNLINNLDNICNSCNSLGGGHEWLPAKTDISLLNTPNSVISDNEVDLPIEKHGNHITFNYDLKSNCNYFIVPLLYYKGYNANIELSNKDILNLKVEKTDNNLVKIFIPSDKSGKITVEYSGTKIQRLSNIINVTSIILVAMCYIYKLVVCRNRQNILNE